MKKIALLVFILVLGLGLSAQAFAQAKTGHDGDRAKNRLANAPDEPTSRAPASPPRGWVASRPTMEMPAAVSTWPLLSLTGSQAKVSLVHAAFVQRGWPPERIRIVVDFSRDTRRVHAEVEGGGDVDIPTSNDVLKKGLCETQTAAIDGLIARYRRAATVAPIAYRSPPCPNGNCQGEGVWDPGDQPHQPARGTVSPRVFTNGRIPGADAVEIRPNLNCSAVQIWYGEGWKNGKVSFLFPNERLKAQYFRSQSPDPTSLIQEAQSLKCEDSSVGQCHKWLKFTPRQ